MAPRVLGRYALYDKIASGGMATVHLGRLLGPVGFARTVAIKRLHPQFAGDPEFVSMFLDEARLVARISHPNVVPTLDVVTTEGELFIVMEYVRGESLARLIRTAGEGGSPIPAATVATLLVGVLQGLHAAHEAKTERGEPLAIVHRDVSPHNILVGVDGVPRVLDFGVAKAMGRVQTTREGQLKGKLAYMAPEQISGETSRATDIYASSIVLWEALTGRRLFGGENEGQVLDRVLKGTRVPPSEYIRGLPAGLDEVTLRGLSMDPKKRYATAREMARALEDAVPLVSASKIGEWVEATAKDTLDHRTERIAAIESNSSTDAPSGFEGLRTETRLSARATDHMVSGQDLDQVPITTEGFTQLSSGSTSRAAREKVRGTGRRRALTYVSLGALLAGGALAAFLSRSAEPRAPSVTASPVTSSTTHDVSALPGLPPLPIATSANSAEPEATPAVAPSVSSAAAAPSAQAPSHPISPRRPLTPPPNHCDPPYSFDARGVRVFKKECL
jgi:serine/threonine protein kinase